MSVDAFAAGPELQYLQRPDGTSELVPGPIRDAFAAAVSQVKSSAGAVDGYLKDAGLDCSKSVRYLAQAAGLDLRIVTEVDAQDVAEIAAKAKWDFNVPKEDTMYVHSAKAFLEACADHHLAIAFR